MAAKSPRTRDELLALPEADRVGGRYPYFGRREMRGDDALSFSDGTDFYTVACRRETPDGPDVWVKVRL